MKAMIVATLELSIAAVASGTVYQATVTSVPKGSKRSATDIIGLITVRLSRLPRELPNLHQPPVDPKIAHEVKEEVQIDNDTHPLAGQSQMITICSE